jgi:hypothetical protein
MEIHLDRRISSATFAEHLCNTHSHTAPACALAVVVDSFRAHSLLAWYLAHVADSISMKLTS